MSEIVKVVRNCQSCQKLSEDIVKVVRNCQSCQKLSEVVKKQFCWSDLIITMIRYLKGQQSLGSLFEGFCLSKRKSPGSRGYLAVPGGYLMVPGGYLNKGQVILGIELPGQLKTNRQEIFVRLIAMCKSYCMCKIATRKRLQNEIAQNIMPYAKSHTESQSKQLIISYSKRRNCAQDLETIVQCIVC